MNNKAKTIFILVLFSALCILCYSLYKWYDYKRRNTELQKELTQLLPISESLTPMDCMVISGNDSTYLKCNIEHFKLWKGYDNCPLSHRDYLLYCYIFAIRDGSSDAATDFVSYYFIDVDNNIIAVDSAMVREAERLLLQAMCDTAADALTKFIAAEWLTEIYNGKYDADLKDPMLHLQYCDSVAKYAKM